MKGDMYVTRSADETIRSSAECGGTVTSLLRFALDSGRVDAVLTVKARNGNRYDAVPTLITSPEELAATAGSLHCASANIPRCLKEYLDGASGLRMAVVCKPCDAKAIIELAKREQVDLDNLLLVGLNCTGTLPPARAKTMIREVFGVDPGDVVSEDIEEGKLTITLRDGTEKETGLPDLEQRGDGRRDNCRRCETNIPTMADIACGKWGATDQDATFVEACSDRGGDFLKTAIQAGCLEASEADPQAVETRRVKDEAAVALAREWQERDVADLEQMTVDERFDYWFGHFSQCIKCFGCRDACPICYCKDCSLNADRGRVSGGEIPPDVMFPMIRIAHVMDSCVNCGQCQDACTMELPLSRLIFAVNTEIVRMFKYEPGMDVDAPPPLKTVTDEELAMSGVEITF